MGDFKSALKTPRALLIGLLSHHILFPAATFLLIQILKPQSSIALGMLLVSSCPAGHISNFFTHRAGGNTALSVSISTLSTFAAFFFMPVNVTFWASRDPGMHALIRDFSLDPLKMFIEIGLLLGVPLAIGLTISHQAPLLAKRLLKPMRIFSMIVFIAFVLVALGSNWVYFKQYATLVMGLVFIHNAMALGSGYGISRLFGLSERDARAVSFETGIQNSGLGLVLIFSFFDGLGGMAIITAWWGMWHIVAGLTLSTYWARKSKHI
jgi:bile acid:Na+ symporter, BASS family